MGSMQKMLLIYHHIKPKQLDVAQNSAWQFGIELEPLLLDEFLLSPQKQLRGRTHLLSLLESADLSILLNQAHRYHFSIGLLPARKSSIVCRLFSIPTQIEKALPLAISPDKAIKLDLLLCNDEAVLLSVMVGYVPFFNFRQQYYERQSLFRRIFHLTKNVASLSRLKPFDLCIATEKRDQIKTAVTGVLILENDIEAFAANLVNETISSQDNKLSAMLVAPSSIIDYLLFLLGCFYYKNRLSANLPKAVSYIKTRELSLTPQKQIDYWIDGRPSQAEKLVFKCIPEGISINVGEQFKIAHDAIEIDKETLKIKNLPQNEERLKRLKKKVPFFSVAQEDDFKDLFLMLKENAQLSGPFFVLMLLSSMLATFGLFLNSAPVVIGAMILAPLMAPIVSVSMAILRNDRKLFKNSLWVFVIGLIAAIAVSALTTLLLPYKDATSEILARLQPSLLDLGVAIVSGMAAAYAHAKESVLKSLPGVAIAVALVPPLCVVGIGLAWLDWAMVCGAGLLFLTNFVGIALTGALTFLFLGFSTALRINWGLGFSLLLMALVSIPLYDSLMTDINHGRITSAVGGQTYQVNNKTIQLDDVRVVSTIDAICLSAVLGSSENITAEDVEALRREIEKLLDQPVKIEATLKIMTPI